MEAALHKVYQPWLPGAVHYPQVQQELHKKLFHGVSLGFADFCVPVEPDENVQDRQHVSSFSSPNNFNISIHCFNCKDFLFKGKLSQVIIKCKNKTKK